MASELLSRSRMLSIIAVLTIVASMLTVCCRFTCSNSLVRNFWDSVCSSMLICSTPFVDLFVRKNRQINFSKMSTGVA